MKKKTFEILLIVIIAALVLFVPIPRGPYDDGGTMEYVALAYRIVVWNRYNIQIDENGDVVVNEKYNKTSVFLFPDNSKNLDELWLMELEKMD